MKLLTSKRWKTIQDYISNLEIKYISLTKDYEKLKQEHEDLEKKYKKLKMEAFLKT